MGAKEGSKEGMTSWLPSGWGEEEGRTDRILMPGKDRE